MIRPLSQPGAAACRSRRSFIVAAAAVAAGAGFRSAVAQGTNVALRVASSPTDSVTPVLWAIRTGAFAKAGLDVSLTRMTSGAAVTAAVVGGTLDIGSSSTVPMISAHAHGVPVTIIAPGELWLSSRPISGLIALRTAPIESAADLSGKTVGTGSLNDLSWLSTHAWIDAHGGDSRAVKFVEVPSVAMLAALEEGRVDAVTVNNPSYSAALASGKVKSIAHPSDGIASRYLSTAWFAATEFISRHDAAIVRFAQVVESSAAYTNAHSSETIPLIAGFSGLDPAALAGMTRGLCGTDLVPRDLQPVIDAASKYGIVPQRFEARALMLSAT